MSYGLLVFGAMGYCHLLVTSEYVFVAAAWVWVCYQMISHVKILENISGKVRYFFYCYVVNERISFQLWFPLISKEQK